MSKNENPKKVLKKGSFLRVSNHNAVKSICFMKKVDTIKNRGKWDIFFLLLVYDNERQRFFSKN
jgi:hypothetical protein